MTDAFVLESEQPINTYVCPNCHFMRKGNAPNPLCPNCNTLVAPLSFPGPPQRAIVKMSGSGAEFYMAKKPKEFVYSDSAIDYQFYDVKLNNLDINDSGIPTVELSCLCAIFEKYPNTPPDHEGETTTPPPEPVSPEKRRKTLAQLIRILTGLVHKSPPSR